MEMEWGTDTVAPCSAFCSEIQKKTAGSTASPLTPKSPVEQASAGITWHKELRWRRLRAALRVGRALGE